MTVLALPLKDGAGHVALVAFLGGLSAATAMVIVEIGRARDHDLEPSRHADRAAPPRRRARRRKASRCRSPISAASCSACGASRSSSSSCSATSITGQRARRRLPSIGLLSFAAIAQVAPAFFGGLFWSRGTALGASAGLAVGFAIWAYTLLLPSLALEGAFWTGSRQARAVRARRCSSRPRSCGSTCRSSRMASLWSLALNILAYVAFSLLRPATPIERLQARPSSATDDAVDGAELPALPARSVTRRRSARDGRALSRRGAHRRAPSRASPSSRGGTLEGTRARPTSTCCAMPSTSSPRPSAPPRRGWRCRCCCAAATSRTKAALQLLDDASAAIQYSRDLLQHALDHARQGITVFDRDLRLLAWNRAFIDLFELPPDLVRVGVGLDEIIRFNAERGSYGPGAVEEWSAQRLDSFVHDAEPVRVRLHPPARSSRSAPTSCRTAASSPPTPTSPRPVAAEEARSAPTRRLEQRVRERTEELTRLNAALDAAPRPRPTRPTSRRPASSPRRATTSCSRSTPRASTPPRSSSATATPATAAPRRERRRLARGRRGDPHRAARHLAPRHRRHEAAMDELPHRRDLPPAAARVRADRRASKGLELTFVPCSLDGPLRPPPAAPAAAEPRLERHQVHAVGPRAGRLRAGAASCVSLQVWDTGLGIPASKQKVVFREFQRLDQGAKVARGLGLGLSIVERIARVLDHPIALHVRAAAAARCSGSRCRSPRPLPAERRRAGAAPRPATPLAGLTVLCDRQRAHDPRGHADAADRAGAATSSPRPSSTARPRGDGRASACPRSSSPTTISTRATGLEVDRGAALADAAEMPAVLLTADRSPAVRDAAAATTVHVLNKPLKPAALRALLAQWRATRVAAE